MWLKSLLEWLGGAKHMLELNCIGNTSSDCTASYDISMDHPYTVREFIDDVLAQFPKEWGYIQLYKRGEIWGSNVVRCEYKSSLLLSSLPEQYMDREVYAAEAWAGFSRMDITLTLQTKGFESWNTEVKV